MINLGSFRSSNIGSVINMTVREFVQNIQVSGLEEKKGCQRDRNTLKKRRKNPEPH